MYISHVFSLLEDKQKSKLGGVMTTIKYYNLHMFSRHLEAFLNISKCILSTFRSFVARVLGEVKKRKISTRGEDFLLLLPATVKDLTVAAGEVTTEVGE